MLVLFDIGNTAVTYGLAQKSRIFDFGTILFDDVPNLIYKLSKSGRLDHLNVIISSVFPNRTIELLRLFNKYPTISFKIAGKSLPIPIKTRYKRNQLGIDRLLTAYGSLYFYKAPCLVIDFGTAITFDYVSAKGVFEGGMIVPGPELSFQALTQKAALLPKKEKLPISRASFLGKTTRDSLKSGILEGFGAMTDGLISRFKARYGTKLKVIATGGFAKHLKPYVRSFDVVDPMLSVKSLLLLYLENTTPQ